MSEFEDANFFTDRSIQDDPYPYFDWVRQQGPVWREPHFGMYMITGHPEAMAIYGDPATFPPNDRPRGPSPRATWSADRSSSSPRPWRATTSATSS